ncbi:MAG: outer membrane protein assembly factor BamD [Psychroflexus salarius]|jgi:outer membrane protein assembly factor BamD
MKYIVSLLLATLFLTSCSEYQKVLKNEEPAPKFDLAKTLYEKGVETGRSKYFTRSIRLFEQILPQYRGKPQGQILAYMNANAYYLNGDYYTSAYLFERFAQSYPRSEKAEEAIFKSAKSYYKVSPVYSKDQSQTQKALDKLQTYINVYPEGAYFVEANDIVLELRTKLDKKYYEIAKQYHHTERYKAAIEAFDNYILDYPGTPFKEKAYFYKFESAYILAINSLRSLTEERLEAAKIYAEDYLRYYSDGEFSELATNYLNDINERLNKKAYEN